MKKADEEHNPPKELKGRFRITWMENWDQDYVHIDGEGFIEFHKEGQGELQFGAVRGWLDCRFFHQDGTPLVEFSWQGENDSDDACGRGWAVAEKGKLKGKIFIHNSDDSAFEATQTLPRKRARAK